MELKNIVDSLTIIYDSARSIGYVQNFTNPVLSVLDWLSGYHSFEIKKDKPYKEDMADKMVYFYLKDDEICYLTKDMPYDEPKILDSNLDKSVYNKILNQISAEDSEILGKNEVYAYLRKEGKIVQGFKYFFYKKITIPYQEFENRFIAKHKKIHQAYIYARDFIRKAGTFATSETGGRIIALATSISLAAVTGGTFLIAATAVYGIGMGIAIAQQAASRVTLNRVKEEAALLIDYASLHKKKLELADNNNIKIEIEKSNLKDSTPLKKDSQLWTWIKSSGQYLSTYAVQIAVPIVIAALSPAGSLIQFGILIASSGVAVGVGIYFQKIENDKINMLNGAIKEVKKQGFLPVYNNVRELEQIVKRERRDVKFLEIIEMKGRKRSLKIKKISLLSDDKLEDEQLAKLAKIDKELDELNKKITVTEKRYENDVAEDRKVIYKSWTQEYGKALHQVVNPFYRLEDVDYRDVEESVKNLGTIVNVNHFVDKKESKGSIFDDNIILLRSKQLREEAFAEPIASPKMPRIVEVKSRLRPLTANKVTSNAPIRTQ